MRRRLTGDGRGDLHAIEQERRRDDGEEADEAETSRQKKGRGKKPAGSTRMCRFVRTLRTFNRNVEAGPSSETRIHGNVAHGSSTHRSPSLNLRDA